MHNLVQSSAYCRHTSPTPNHRFHDRSMWADIYELARRSRCNWVLSIQLYNNIDRERRHRVQNTLDLRSQTPRIHHLSILVCNGTIRVCIFRVRNNRPRDSRTPVCHTPDLKIYYLFIIYLFYCLQSPAVLNYKNMLLLPFHPSSQWHNPPPYCPWLEQRIGQTPATEMKGMRYIRGRLGELFSVN